MISFLGKNLDLLEREHTMKLSSCWIIVALFVNGLSMNSVLAAGNIEAGKQKSAVCAACHNIDGNSTVPAWPKLAGQHQAYLVKQLKEYKLGEAGPRYDPQMIGMVANLTEQDMQDLSAYFSNQKQTPGKALSDYVKLCEKIYRGGNVVTGVAACTACHGPKGAGNLLAKYPKVSGQHADYTEAQLKAFRDKKRHNDINGIMQDIAKRMTDEEIKAVSQYIAGLH